MAGLRRNRGSLIGKQFSAWTVIGDAGPGRWLCRCSCGTEKTMRTQALQTSRRCWQCHLAALKARNSKAPPKLKHGLAGTPEYKTWVAMRHRCSCRRDDHHCYQFYGSKGIRVCDDWDRLDGGFERFMEHLGTRPPTCHSIDRIDNSKGYEPGNVRWATNAQQARNTSRNHYVRGTIFTDAATLVGISPGTAFSRAQRGWSDAKATSTQPDARFRKLTPSRKWTSEDDAVILSASSKEQAAATLGRSYSSVQARALRLGRSFGHRWTPAEDAVILSTTAVDASRRLGLTIGAIRTRACRLRKKASP